ncbi:hypothetical protein AB1Y20_007271 [Prymnesium parvum]|uniref:Heterogeneous nuclear ribonucleoprotein Q acidic domain-containing protein n=1 Tax=Prymnesium parvum TaxID=97485 RepID=A0AB34IWN8_PRYPA
MAFSLFCNQLPYTATREDVAAFFAEALSAEPAELLPRIRMILKPGRDGSLAFSGTCFVDAADAPAQQRALALHEQTMRCADGTTRSVNVRRALTQRQLKELPHAEEGGRGGGGGKAAVRKMVRQAMEEGRLLQEDVDERAFEFLCNVPADVARRAISEFAQIAAADGLAGVKNRSSFFMGVLRQRQRGESTDTLGPTAHLRGAHADEAAAKGGRGRGKGKGGKGAKGGKGREGGKGGRGGHATPSYADEDGARASGGSSGKRARAPATSDLYALPKAEPPAAAAAAEVVAIALAARRARQAQAKAHAKAQAQVAQAQARAAGGAPVEPPPKPPKRRREAQAAAAAGGHARSAATSDSRPAWLSDDASFALL